MSTVLQSPTVLQGLFVATPPGSISQTSGSRILVGPYVGIAPDTATNWASGGAGTNTGKANVIGTNGTDTRNTGNNLPSTVTTSQDSVNFPQWVNWSSVWGGYDSINNGWACEIIGSKHSYIQLGSQHSKISGGSWHQIGWPGGPFGQYDSINGGTYNTVLGHYGTIGGGQQNTTSGYVHTISSGQTGASITDASANSSDVGAGVYGKGIPSGTYVQSVNAGVSLTLNNAATGTGTSVTLGPRKDSITVQSTTCTSTDTISTSSGTLHLSSASTITSAPGQVNVVHLGTVYTVSYTGISGNNLTGATISSGTFTTSIGDVVYSSTVLDSQSTSNDVGKPVFGGQNSSNLVYFNTGTVVSSVVAGTSMVLSNPPTGPATLLTVGQYSGETIAGGYNNAVQGNNATLVGGTNNVIEYGANWSAVVGGLNHIVQSYGSFIGGGNRNEILGTSNIYSTIAGGYHNTISSTATYGFIGGGQGNTVSSQNATVLGGQTNTSSGIGSLAVGGYNNTASGSYSTVVGRSASTSHYGALSHSSHEYSSAGDNQIEWAGLTCQTTSASTVEMFLDGTTASQRLTIPIKTSWNFECLIVAREVDGSAAKSASFTVVGLVSTDSSGVPTLIGSTVTQQFASSGATSWAVAVSVVTVGAGTSYLKFTGAGATSTTVQWTNRIEIAELTGVN